jgi:XTP/dITP diphosphohydrolase
MNRRVILSSGNMHKVKEIKDILKDMPFDVVSKDELGFRDFDVEEDGQTLEENALKKAVELSKLVKGVIIADDTGLFVDALNGEPGVYSARYAGEHVSYADNNKKLLKKLEGLPLEKRTAYFKTSIAVVLEDGSSIMAEGRCSGKIGFEPRGENGFGYDPLFIEDKSGKTLSEMSEEEKNSISHRANALVNLKEKLEEIVQ